MPALTRREERRSSLLHVYRKVEVLRPDIPPPWNIRIWFHDTRVDWDRVGLDVFTYFKALHRCRTGERR